MLAAIIIAALLAFEVSMLTRSWRAQRLKQKRAQRLRAMSGVIERGGR